MVWAIRSLCCNKCGSNQPLPQNSNGRRTRTRASTGLSPRVKLRKGGGNMNPRCISLVCALTMIGCASRPSGTHAPAGVAGSEAVRPFAAEYASATGGAKPRPLLDAMRQELKRSMASLEKSGDLPPYFMAYQVTDRQSVAISASVGALLNSDETHRRGLDVDVRVGDHRLDNTHSMRGRRLSAHGSGRTTLLPLEGDGAATRALLWLITDGKYKRAVEDLLRIRTDRKVRVKEEDDSHDFSQEEPVTFIEEPLALSVDRGPWEERLRRLSSRFKRHEDIHASRVSLGVIAQTRYLVNSEGTTVQVGRNHARLSFFASTTAEDGMKLSRFDAIDVNDLARLPDDAEIERRLQRVIDDLMALRQAPLAEPYVGPAILEGKAAAVFFHEIFGHRVEGHRQKDESEGQTFAKKVGKLVMPPFMRVYDDPSLLRLNGTDLNGHYLFDDEGVRGGRAELVTDGVLKGFLLSRAPTRGFVHSNGHGRRQEGHRVVARQGNLVVDPALASSPADLKQALIDEVKRQGKPYGLRFAEVTGGYTQTSRRGTQGFKVKPVIVSRVYPDGREELVRGADFVGTPLVTLSKILAAGREMKVFNGTCGAESGWVPVSAVSPSLLVGQIEVARKEKGQQRPPLLPPPPTQAGDLGLVRRQP